MASTGSKSIANRVAWIIGSACALVMALGMTGMQLLYHAEVDRNAQKTLDLLSESVILPFKSSIDASKGHAVGQAIAELGSLPGIERLRVFDAKGKVIWSLSDDEKGQPLPAALLATFRAESQAYLDGAGSGSMGLIRQLRARPSCIACHRSQGTRIEVGGLLGGVHVQASRERLTSNLTNYAHIQVTTSLLLLAFVIVLTILVMRVYVTGPLRKLNRALDAASQGNFLKRADIAQNDDFGVLARRFNTLLQRLTEEQASKIDSQMQRDLAQRELGLKSELEEKNLIIEETNRKLKDRLNDLSLLYDITKALTSTLDMDRVLEVINELLGVTLKFQQFCVLQMDERRGALEIKFAYGADPHLAGVGSRVDPAEGIVAQAIRTDRYVLVSDLSRFERQSSIEQALPDNGSTLVIPMRFRDALLGVLNFTRPERDAFDEREIRFLNAVARQAAMAMLNAKLYQEKLELSVTDDLTKLANRRRMQTRLELEWNRARRFGTSLSVMMIDIDFFKRYNDINGHMLGDQVLFGVAQVLTANTRKVDTVARFGGEEFVVILPGQDKDAAAAVADKLRRAIARTDFPRTSSQPAGHLSISVGVATYPIDSEDPSELLDSADLALYVAKRSGRDQVKAYEEGMRKADQERQESKNKKSRKRRRRRRAPANGRSGTAIRTRRSADGENTPTD